MIENYFTKFNTSSEYNTYKESSGYTVPNVSWIVKENKIKTEKKMYYLTSGVVVHKNGEFKGVSYEDFDAHYSDIIGSGYTIEGIIVVPSNHTPDGTTRIMSLKNMSTTTGGSSSELCFGGREVDLSGLTDYTEVAGITNETGETTVSGIDYGYLPSDEFSGGTGAQSVVDEKAKYNSSAESGYLCPSPYLKDDKPNPLYKTTTIVNGLSDFDGSANTEVIIANATSQIGWQTASTITNSYSAGWYPAACCCKRYSTSGLPAGSWYLPALGEVGYLAARLGTIKSLLALIISKDSSIAETMYLGGCLSSSEYSGEYTREVFLESACIVKSDKKNNTRVRAFASVNITPLNF